MKIFAILFFLLCAVTAGAQKNYDDVYGVPVSEKKYTKESLRIPTKDGKIFYEQIVECQDGKKELYLKARKWFVDTFKNANSVLQMDDKEDGKLAGKAIYDYSFDNGVSTSRVTIFFTLNIDIKDKKYRVQFYDMYGNNENTNNLTNAISTFGSAMSSSLNGRPSVQAIQPSSFKIDYNQTLSDFLNDKRLKYNGKILDGMNNGVSILFSSLEKVMKASYSNDF